MRDEDASITPDTLLAEIDRLAAEVRALSAEVEAQEQRANLGLLTQWLAHEVANRLTPVAGYAGLALRTPEDHDLCSLALTHAKLGCERLAELAQLLLSLANDRQPKPNHVADVAAAWSAVSGLLQRDAGAKEVELRGSVAAGQHVSMAPAALEHVLLNLTTNALKATPAGGVIEFEVGKCSTGNNTLVEIRLSDTGPGIPDAVLARAFEVGYSNSGGSGLGLALVKRLVEAAGGGVAIHSSLGTGTTAIVRLPAKAA
ncbi:MAG: HAMP domain-containing histidine kinase [Phycisphaerales bacterium]|nr:HAMP domain-containing histidine kinase [Phycisphaerales bacterium]